MTSKLTITREQVRERIEYIESLNARGAGTAVHQQQFELACLRELLSCMESEPVGYIHNFSIFVNGRAEIHKSSSRHYGRPLYTSPQPVPAVQCPFPCGWDNLNKLATQDAALVARGLVEGEPTTEAHRQAAIANSNRLLKVISACRAAMLNHSPAAGENYSPVIGIDHAAEPDRTVEVKYSAPPGWVLVPKEPTHAMLMAWLSEVANWRGHEAGYKAMLAAVQQEVTRG